MSDLRICRVVKEFALSFISKFFDKAFTPAERPSDIPPQTTNEMTFGAASSRDEAIALYYITSTIENININTTKPFVAPHVY